MTDDCRDGRLEVYLPSRSLDYPFMSVCGHNVTKLKDLPLLTSKDVLETVGGASSLFSGGGESPRNQHRRRRRYVHVRFVGNIYPHKAQFKIAWSALNHLPRGSDAGALHAARRTAAAAAAADDNSRGDDKGRGDDSGRDDDNGRGDDDCAFPCPGDERLCLPARSVCNGVVNCPGVPNDESPATCSTWNLESAAAASDAVDGAQLSAVTLFAAVVVAIVAFGAALFAASAYCNRRRRRGSPPTACAGRRRRRSIAGTRSSDRIYSTVRSINRVCFGGHRCTPAT